MRSWALDTGRCFGYTAARTRGENSDAKNGERSSVCRGPVRWAIIRTPCGCGIGCRNLRRCIQDKRAALDYPHLRNNLSRSVKTFRCDAIRLTRMRHHHQTHGLNRWMIHGGMIVNHSRHGVRRLAAVALTFQARVAFAHERAEPGRSNNAGHQDSQENYRSCGSSRHFRKLYLRPYEMRKLVQGLSSQFPPTTRTTARDCPNPWKYA